MYIFRNILPNPAIFQQKKPGKEHLRSSPGFFPLLFRDDYPLIWQSPDNNSSFRAEPAGISRPAGRQW
ncbi:hypothetical protein, partial [Phocaeicola sartorii]|uniref:hypothetical protein n=1 Tax=Phocaeicola sartorii TaxID=671267 RepID=UPI002632C123